MSKRNVRQDAIDAVYAVCAKVGLENLTTKRISQQAHASEAMIYYHFKSKRELLEGAFLAIHEEIDALFERAFAERSFSLAADTYTVCLETWLLYYGYWRDNPEKTAFYDTFIHSRYITHELWTNNNASYVFFTTVFGGLMHNLVSNTGETAFAYVWPVIIDSAISMAKRANATGEELDESAKDMIGRVLQSILSFATDC